MDWISLIQTLGGIVGGFGIGSFSKSRRRKEKAEADKAVKDVYEERMRDLHSIIDNFNTTERSHSERISELNKALDDKTDRIRSLTDKVWDAERETNRINDLLMAEQRRTADLRVQVEYLKMWRCEWPDCQDPRGRKPPNEKLKGLRYEPPVSTSLRSAHDGKRTV